MKNLYVYVLRGKDIQEHVMYDIVAKRNGDIIRREDNYYYSQHGYGKRRGYISGTRKVEDLEKFNVACYCKKDGEEHHDWFIEFVSYKEQLDLVTLKREMIKAYNEYHDKRCNDKLDSIDREYEEAYKKMIEKRKACVEERDALKELSFNKFL